MALILHIHTRDGDEERHWVTSNGAHLLVSGSGENAKVIGGRVEIKH
jgi:hypothetical protein